MPTLELTHKETFEAFARPLIESGKYPSADAVLAAAMDALLREECDDQTKVRFLKRAIEDGDASGIAEGDVVARIRERAGLPARAVR